MALPTYFVSHGGGPWPWMKEQTGGAYDRLEASLAALRQAHGDAVRSVGSGLSFHNLRQFGPAGAMASRAFDGWLQETMALAPSARSAALLRWEEAPMARAAHPREEHLLPLMVALGAAEQEPAACVYHEEDFFGSLTVSSFRFGS